MTTTTTENPSSLAAIMELQNAETPAAETPAPEGTTYADMLEDTAEAPTEVTPSEPVVIGSVTVSEMGKSIDVPLEAGMTVFDALEAAEIDPTGYSLRLNGPDEVSGTHGLQAGDSIRLARQIRGA